MLSLAFSSPLVASAYVAASVPRTVSHCNAKMAFIDTLCVPEAGPNVYPYHTAQLKSRSRTNGLQYTYYAMQ